MTKIWVENVIDESKASALQKQLGIAPLTAKLLVSKGIESHEQARAFLKPNFKEELHSPSLLKDIEKVVQRINMAIEKEEKILFHGDYDTDGVTTTSIAIKSLRMLGVEIDFYVPNRFKDGYGINRRNVERFSKYDLIITGDVGIKAFDAIYELTHTYGTDVIVTDHHEPVVFPLEKRDRIPEMTITVENEKEIMALPDCFAIINPKRIDCDYQSKDLSGAAVIWKVMEALFDSRGQSKKELYYMLDIVAAGLVADLVPFFNLKDCSYEVRNIVKIGLEIMNKSPKPWVQSILDIKEKTNTIKSEDLGFVYGPILNAVGRLYDPTPAVHFLIEEDYEAIIEQAQYLNDVNEERKTLSRETSSNIVKELKDLSEERVDYGIVVYSPDLHIGITGLVAGNILNDYYRPTIALARFETEQGDVIYRGSARSIEGISVLDALIEVEHVMGKFIYGGHEQAAGLTLTPEQVEPFIEAFREACKVQAEGHDENVFSPKMYYDSEVRIEEADFSVMSELDSLEPYGMGNEKPKFSLKNVAIDSLKPHKKGNGVTFTFVQDGATMKGIIFSGQEHYQKAYENELKNNTYVPCEVLGELGINEYMGNKTIQFSVKDIRIGAEVKTENPSV